MISKKGFLFTISVIFFASTLVFFAQTFSTNNNANEARIIDSARGINLFSAGDDISFDLERIFGINADYNYGSTSSTFVSGVLSDNPTISTSISNYSTFLNNSFFPRVTGTKSIDLSSLSDGVMEVFFGSFFEFDYDYQNQTAFIYPLQSNVLQSVDINLYSTDFNTYQWVGTGSEVTLNIHFYGDSNSLSLTKTVDTSSASSLLLIFNDANAVVRFGSVLGKTSAVFIDSNRVSAINYSIKSNYSSSSGGRVFFNAILRNTLTGIDSNSFIVLRR